MREREVLLLNDDFRYALYVLEQQRRPAFITGRAGTGKSTLLQLFRHTTRQKTVVLAPTGAAAVQVRGQTIHSFFGFPPHLITPRMLGGLCFAAKSRRPLYEKIEVLVIDEISMVRADLLDTIDAFLRHVRRSEAPFGGVQVVFFGDLFQLPPVVSKNPEERYYLASQYVSPYFFSAHVFGSAAQDFEMIELRRVYRQNSPYFLQLLEAVRTNRLTGEDLDALNERYDPHFPHEDGYLTLCARNSTVDRINHQKLGRLPGRALVYRAEIFGQFDPNVYPTDLVLLLKKGAQVMFIKNDSRGQYVNGTIGVVSHLDEDTVEVRIQEAHQPEFTVEVQPVDWEIIRYKIDPATGELTTEVTGVFRQLPLRLAWAITIHKSQGKTFDRVIIDLAGGAFEHGQLYVALSRCRSLEGLVLRHPVRPRDVIVDERVVDFFERYFRR